MCKKVADWKSQSRNTNKHGGQDGGKAQLSQWAYQINWNILVLIKITKKCVWHCLQRHEQFIISLGHIRNVSVCACVRSPQVTTDKKSLAYVDNMLKKSNKKVEELHQDLQELNAHIVVKDPEELLGSNRNTAAS